jgi:hypothetical protein
MNIVRKTGMALVGGVGFALLAAAMFTSDPATAFGRACSMAGGTQLGKVDSTPEDPSVCVRRRVYGVPPEGLTSCHQVAFNLLGCKTVFTASGPPAQCTMGGGTRLGYVYVSAEDPSVCVRRRAMGSPPGGLDSCHAVAKDYFDCTTVYTGP